METDIYIYRFKHICTHQIGFHGNIPRWGISKLVILLVSSDLVFFSIDSVKLL